MHETVTIIANKYIYTATCFVALVLSASYNAIQLVKVLGNIQYIIAVMVIYSYLHVVKCDFTCPLCSENVSLALPHYSLSSLTLFVLFRGCSRHPHKNGSG